VLRYLIGQPFMNWRLRNAKEDVSTVKGHDSN
jgi:hypothetical protein